MFLVLMIFMLVMTLMYKDSVSSDTLLIFYGLLAIAESIVWSAWLARVQRKQLSDKDK